MSEPIPESIPTSADPKSRRPLKKTRITNPNAPALLTQKHAIDTLFLEPDRPLTLPASSTGNKRALPAPPEIVANVQGSSAGAGSGEFHVYKASRRREYERLRVMEEEARDEVEGEKWEKEQREKEEKEVREREKRRRERERRKKRKNGKQGSGGGEGDTEEGAEEDASVGNEVQKQKRLLHVPKPDRGTGEGHDAGEYAANESGFGVAPVLEENGITIHDDD